MKFRALVPWLLALLINTSSLAAREDPIPAVLGGKIEGQPAEQMMSRYLMSHVRAASAKWRADYELRTTPEAIRERQTALKSKFLEAIGDLPKRTPLRAEIGKTFERPGYRVEQVMFESQPDHHVTALLFLPDVKKFPPPYPGVIIPCGHASEGKANEGYQRGAALLALNGMAGLVFDPIGQGERIQSFDPAGKHKFVGTHEHLMVGVGSILLGENTARFEIWDGMRALDYLESREDIDSKKLGCMGNSGGGTQTSYLMALDDRIVAAAPSCYLTTFERLIETIGAQDAEQNIFGQLAFGMDHADYLIMRAPKPTLICCATQDFFDIQGTKQTYRDAKQVYTRLGTTEKVELVEVDAKHGWHQPLREASVRWMSRWLLGKDIEAVEPPELKLLIEEETYCSPQGQVMRLEVEQSVYDLNRETLELRDYLRERRLNSLSSPPLGEWRKYHDLPEWKDVPLAKVEVTDAIQRDGYTVRTMVFHPESGIVLPALMLIPKGDKTTGPPVLLVDSQGKAADQRAVELVRAGRLVLTVDLRGYGETQQEKQNYGAPHFGRDVQDYYAAYLLGKSYVGMRAFDTAVVTKFLANRDDESRPVELIAVGRACTPALHAAAIYPDRFSKVTLIRPLRSWSIIVEEGESMDRMMETVHGALHHYDLPDLVKSLEGKIHLLEPAGRTVGLIVRKRSSRK